MQGLSLKEAAEDLGITPNTARTHLKHIFEKTGVHSRRDLVSKIFFAYYEPRLRDNELRVPVDKPLRGGPMTSALPRA